MKRMTLGALSAITLIVSAYVLASVLWERLKNLPLLV
ncbi:hypothetical protein LOM8899_01378 [Flavimaricola marinus]|uniref:Uncharacterized protein n=1 Tax=Flavimaricola marinus TaxID=1819565 RepID=A0A238LCU5_9RHOB|nr:hypothetical protein LOM8899_01378 [Flavimaricola marinus]